MQPLHVVIAQREIGRRIEGDDTAKEMGEAGEQEQDLLTAHAAADSVDAAPI
jgi:hypothetical protein